MRICHALAGECVEVEDQELQWKKPIDVVKQRACERWKVSPDDLILLADGGDTVSPNCSTDDFGQGRSVFLFLRSVLDPKAVRRYPEPLYPDAGSGEEYRDEALEPEAEDPAFEAFHRHIAEAQRALRGSRPAAGLAAQAERRLEVQRLAGRAVLDNLKSHRAACDKSMDLFLQKYGRVQERFDQVLDRVKDSMAMLSSVPLHPTMRSVGREYLADVVPQDRILAFTGNLQKERDRLGQRLEKLQQQRIRAQALCDEVAAKMEQFVSEGTDADRVAQGMREGQSRAESELLRILRSHVPRAGAAAPSVLEQEKRSAGALGDLVQVCGAVRDDWPQLEAAWDQRQGAFLLRLREVSYTQSKVRDFERQAALLEEEINEQRSYAQQLGHLGKLPKAYQKMLWEVARRRRFREKYAARAQEANGVLSRMCEEENDRRRAFLRHYSCHLPADIVQGLGALAPTVTAEMPQFDVLLPEIDYESLQAEEAAAGASCGDAPRGEAEASIGMPGAGSGAECAAARSGSTSQSSTQPGSAPSGAMEGAAGGPKGPDVAVGLHARNRELEAEVESLKRDLDRLRVERGVDASDA